MKKKLLLLTSIILFTVASMLFLSTNAIAAPEETAKIMIGNKYIYDANGTETVETIEGVTYDENSNNLTLENFNGEGIFIDNCDNLTLEVRESNKVNEIASQGNIKIIGEGKLEISSEAAVGIIAANLEIEDIELIISMKHDDEAGIYCEGIFAHGEVKIDSAHLTITGVFQGIGSNEDVKVNGEEIDITATGYGLYSDKNITIEKGKLTLKSDIAGIMAGNVKFNGGITKIDAGEAAVIGQSKTEGTFITLAEKMAIEEKVTIQDLKIADSNFEIYFTAFGTDEIIIDYENQTFENMATKLTIKEKVEYKFTEGAKQTYTINKDENAKFKIDADHNKVVSVYVDSKLLNEENGDYTIAEGSTVVTLSKNYLNTLSVGEHKLTVNFTDGKAETTFSIDRITSTGAPAEPEKDDTPKTGNISNKYEIAIYAIMLVISIAGIIITKSKIKE